MQGCYSLPRQSRFEECFNKLHSFPYQVLSVRKQIITRSDTVGEFPYSADTLWVMNVLDEAPGI